MDNSGAIDKSEMLRQPAHPVTFNLFAELKSRTTLFLSMTLLLSDSVTRLLTLF